MAIGDRLASSHGIPETAPAASFSSCPDLIRASINLHKKPSYEEDGLPGQARQ
jgi:hypothetical protein